MQSWLPKARCAFFSRAMSSSACTSPVSRASRRARPQRSGNLCNHAGRPGGGASRERMRCRAKAFFRSRARPAARARPRSGSRMPWRSLATSARHRCAAAGSTTCAGEVRGGRGGAGARGAAHAHWWSFIAPLLTREYQVVAPDLTGHGDSGRREEYPREIWAEEVMAVAEHGGHRGRADRGRRQHGRIVTIVTAARYGDRLAGAMIVDTPVRRPIPRPRRAREARPSATPRPTPT